MARIVLSNLGSAGIVRDQPGHTLPPEVWTDGRNVRFLDNNARRFLGHTPVFDPPQIAPYWGLPVRTSTELYWIYAGLSAVYTYVAGTHADITRASGAYNALEDDLWNGGVFGGIPILNNGIDIPQMWAPVSTSQRLVDLTAWPSTLRARIVRPFKNYIFALNCTKSGTSFPHMVKWSHSADPGTVPTSWDETDPTLDAGEFDLSDTESGIIREGLQLRDILVVYKDSSTHGLQFTGGRFIWRRFQILTTSGILADHCVNITSDGTRHFVATGDDIIIHEGQTVQSVIDKRWRKYLSNAIDTDYFRRSFVARNPSKREMMFCFPEVGAQWPSLALVWNEQDGAIGIRDLSNISFMASGPVQDTVVGATWDATSTPWDSDTDPWDTQSFLAFLKDTLMFNPVDTKLLHFDQTNQFAGTDFPSFVERTGLAIVGVNRQGEPIVDLAARKLLNRVWPRADGAPFYVSVAAAEDLGGAYNWSAPVLFDPSVDKWVDVCASGRVLAIRFESSGGGVWQLHGYDLELEVTSLL